MDELEESLLENAAKTRKEDWKYLSMIKQYKCI